MRNSDKIKERLNRVKTLKSYTEAVNALADITYEIGMDACSERKALREDITLLRKILLGNGSPENAVLPRLQNLEDNVSKTNKLLEGINNALIGDIKGAAGIMDRLKKTESQMLTMNKVGWLIISTVIVDIILRILGSL